jgi:excinuclease UvrABC nuclease subunit
MFEQRLGKKSLRQVKSQNNKIQVLVKDNEHPVDLNTLVTDSQMNSLKIEDKLIKQLLMDDIPVTDSSYMDNTLDIL